MILPLDRAASDEYETGSEFLRPGIGRGVRITGAADLPDYTDSRPFRRASSSQFAATGPGR
jgi:hypothetical protein